MIIAFSVCVAARRKVKLCHRKWRLRSRYCDDDLEYLSALSWSVLSRYTMLHIRLKPIPRETLAASVHQGSTLCVTHDERNDYG